MNIDEHTIMEKYDRFWFSKRFLVAIFCLIGEMNIFSCNANLNIAILDMTSSHQVIVGNATITQHPEFTWDSKTKGFILGAHSYGILLSPVGGYFAMRFGGSTVISSCYLVVSVLTILTPWIIRYNFYLYVGVRIIEGVTEAFRFVSFPELWTKWSPIRDRSKLLAVTLSGMAAGPAIAYPIFGIITQKYRWPATFYYTGGFSLLCTILWYLLVPNSPASDKWISKEELSYIQQDPPQRRPKSFKKMCKKMIRSKPVYAVGVTKMIFNLGIAMTVTCLPMYIKDITGKEISKVGMYSAIPTAVNICSVPSIGFVMDYLNNTGCLTITHLHKLFMCGAFIVGGITLLLTAHLPYNFILLMACLTLLKLCQSINFVVSNLNIIALAPKCSSILTSFTIYFYIFSSIMGPLIIGFIVTSHDPSQWNTFFITLAITSFVGALIFFTFGSSEPQPWAYSVEEQSKEVGQSKDNQTISTQTECEAASTQDRPDQNSRI